MNPKLYRRDLALPGILIFTGRADFEQHFHTKPPIFDVTKPKKFWTDDPVAGTGVNFPGGEYEVYVVPPSDSTIGRNAANPLYLVSNKQMSELMVEILQDTGKVLTASKDFTQPPSTLVLGPKDRADNRAAWKLGNSLVGFLLKEKYANGIGSPGKWELDSNGDPHWKSEAVATDNDLPTADYPIRKLLDTEQWYTPLLLVTPVCVSTGGWM